MVEKIYVRDISGKEHVRYITDNGMDCETYSPIENIAGDSVEVATVSGRVKLRKDASGEFSLFRNKGNGKSQLVENYYGRMEREGKIEHLSNGCWRWKDNPHYL